MRWRGRVRRSGDKIRTRGGKGGASKENFGEQLGGIRGRGEQRICT